MNPVKGEVTFEALGKSWRFKMGNAAFVALETQYNTSIAAVLDKFQDANAHQMTLVQSVFLAGLKRHHPEVTSDVASDIIDDIGLEPAVKIIMQSVSMALPAAKEGENPT